ncbi:MAG: ABC transporter substrate-binding protein [Elusimicrobia bacterium]|nr:ABC transporter substrate-binding protein [Elusimicrobiota bacterium]
MITAISLAAALLGAVWASPVKNPDTYTVLDFAELETLDPAWPTEKVSQGVILSLYETLFDFDPGKPGALLPLIAAKVPTKANGLVSADGRTYTIPIRRGIKFHDGSPLTAEDARYSLLRFILQDRTGGPSSLLLEPILGTPSTRDEQGRVKPGIHENAAQAVQAQGQNLVLRLPAPYAPLLSILATRAPVVSKNWAASHGDWDGKAQTWERHNNPRKDDSIFLAQANGTGPFHLERWDRKNRELVLARHDGYWRAPAKLARVILRTIPEFGTRKLMLQAGDADQIAADRGTASQLAGLPGVRVMDDLPSPGAEPIVYFSFAANPAANPYVGSGRLDGDGIPPDFFADKDMREAFAYSFDYGGLIRDVYRGQARRATGCIPTGILGHNPAQRVRSYDLGKAREHFRKAWQGQAWDKGFHFTLVYNAGNVSRQILCQMLKRQVESLSPKFRLDIRALEWPGYLDAYHAKRLPLVFFAHYPDYPDPHSPAFDVMHSQGASASVQGYKNPEADRLVEKALAETDAKKRAKLYFKLQELEYEDLPHVLFVEAKALRVARDWVRGFTYDPLSPNPHFEKIYKKGASH